MRVFVDPGLPARLWTDPTRLRQVLTNLVGNAIKFSGDREGMPGRVSVRACRAAGTAWMLQVRDNGIGMTSASRSRLFTSFAQAETSTTRRFGGTGLGLAISHRLVGLMGGLIEVDSEPQVGSTFTVRLPTDAVHEDALPSPKFDLSGIECVVVESPELDYADLAAYLEPVGAKMHAVSSMSRAVTLARALSSAVVIAHHCGHQREPAVAPEFERAPEIPKVLFTAQLDPATDWDGANVVAVESNALRRVSLLRAVGAAAGRMSLEAKTSPIMMEAALDREPVPTIAEARATGRLILVAEDDAINRKVILHQLGMLGHAAEVAEDGVEALELWRQGGHGLLLTDLHMPKMDGYTLTSTIRSEESGLRLPILALTANALNGEVARARAAGIDEYLTKPMQLHLLGAALAKWLGAASGDEMPAARFRSAGETVYDPAVLPRVIGHDDAVVRTFLADYLASAGQLAEEILQALKHRDAAKVAASAHKLKSSSRAVGAHALGDVCAALENVALTTGAADLAVHRADFETSMAAMLERVSAQVGRDGAAPVGDIAHGANNPQSSCYRCVRETEDRDCAS